MSIKEALMYQMRLMKTEHVQLGLLTCYFGVWNKYSRDILYIQVSLIFINSLEERPSRETNSWSHWWWRL